MKKHASKALCPVSKKFYSYISGRVRESMCLVGCEKAVGVVMACIDRYMTDGTVPPTDSDPAVMLTFALLRPEIDKAMERSIRARRRRNRAQKSVEKPAEKADATTARQSVAANAATDCTATTGNAASETAGDDGDDEPKQFVPRNRRERRLYEQEVRRATKRFVRRLVSA